MSVSPWMISFATSSFVAVLAAFLAAYFAVRRTKVETRWHAKYDAYAKILASIEDMRFWAEESYATEHMLPSIGQKQLEAAAERYTDAKRALSSFVHVGELLVCEEARDKLEQLLSGIGQEEFRFEDEDTDDSSYGFEYGKHCDNVRKIIVAALPDILRLAKADLA